MFEISVRPTGFKWRGGVAQNYTFSSMIDDILKESLQMRRSFANHLLSDADVFIVLFVVLKYFNWEAINTILAFTYINALKLFT